MPNVRIIVAGERNAHLRDLAERAGLDVVGEAPSQSRAAEIARELSADVILHWGVPDVACEASLPTVVLADDEDLPAATGAGPLALGPSGSSEAFLVAAVHTAGAWSRALTRAQHEAETLRDQLETRKLVEQAKGILMQRLGLSESEAYRKLQRASQDENRKMRDVADSIVRTERILSENTGKSTGKGPSSRSTTA